MSRAGFFQLYASITKFNFFVVVISLFCGNSRLTTYTYGTMPSCSVNRWSVQCSETHAFVCNIVIEVSGVRGLTYRVRLSARVLESQKLLKWSASQSGIESVSHCPHFGTQKIS